MRIAIIGAGMAGLSCGQRLAEGGHEVELFDKGRAAGGRMSTRRMEAQGETLRFDHGAQYFTARDPGFTEQVRRWADLGIVGRWPSAGPEAWVGTPAMNAPLRHMAEALDPAFSVRIESISKQSGGWQLHGDGARAKNYDAVVIALPAEQAAPMLAPHDQSMARIADTTEADPCWTVMAAFAQPLDFTPNILRDQGPIGWAARNNSKPGRESQECWVIQAEPEWSRNHLEDDAATIESALLGHLEQAIETSLPPRVASSAHRWRYARSGSAGKDYMWNKANAIGVCGDWLIAPRVESAWVSGRMLAEAVLEVN